MTWLVWKTFLLLSQLYIWYISPSHWTAPGGSADLVNKLVWKGTQVIVIVMDCQMCHIYIRTHKKQVSPTYTHTVRGETHARIHTQYIHRYSIQIPVLLGERVCTSIYIECAQEREWSPFIYCIYVCFLSFRRKQTNEMEFCGGTAIAFFLEYDERVNRKIDFTYIS